MTDGDKAPDGPFRLGAFVIEPARNAVLLGEKSFSIEPRIMDVLCLLAETPDEVVTRDHMIGRIWKVRHGADESITRAISLLRRTFREAGETAPYIETVPKRGYRLVANVAPVDAAAASNAGARNPADNIDPAPDGMPAPSISETGKRAPALWIVAAAAIGVAVLVVFLIDNRRDDAANVQTAEQIAVDAAGADSENLEAFRRYQEARILLNKRGLHVARAIIKFEEAIELDPSFARAYAGLASAHLVSANHLRTPTEVAHSRAREMAAKALELNSRLSEPDAVLAAIEGLRNNWGEALDYLDRAEKHDPRNTRVMQWYSEGLLNLGFADAGLEKIVDAVAVEPDSAVLNHVAANAYALVGDDENAIDYYERAQRLGFKKARLNRGLIHLKTGEHEAAAKAFALYAREMEFVAESRVEDLTRFLEGVIAGDIVVSENLIAFPTLTSDEDFLAMLYLYAGDGVNFLKLIERDADNDKAWFWTIWGDFIPGLRDDLYFAAFSRNTGLLTYWRDREFPPSCYDAEAAAPYCYEAVPEKT